MDTMTIEVLADGTIKTTTGRISGPNHANADAFLKSVEKIVGGTTEIKRRGDAHHHTHDHAHDHTHDSH